MVISSMTGVAGSLEMNQVGRRPSEFAFLVVV